MYYFILTSLPALAIDPLCVAVRVIVRGEWLSDSIYISFFKIAAFKYGTFFFCIHGSNRYKVQNVEYPPRVAGHYHLRLVVA
ncbi:uncharacterized protein V1513DRAFT_438493 [Lipomyces chichibuensis]|uniref:uncharacterized protein n=1 Tax=Lipomyces chichibuensis TaxID=1546026 RepID=UPI003343EE4F